MTLERAGEEMRRRVFCLYAGAVRRNYEAIASRTKPGLAVMVGTCERM